MTARYNDPRSVAGKSLAQQGKSSLYFGIKITDEANIKTEKAQYIMEAFEALAQLLRKLHEQSYIYMQDVIATTYGYGGRTQEHRYHQA